MSNDQNTGIPDEAAVPAGESAPSEGSASDELDAARGGSAADDEPAVEQGTASDGLDAAANDADADRDADATAAAGGSAGDEADAARGGSAADDEPAIRSARKTREGVVTSASMDKTIVVTVTDRVRHPKYNKFVLRSKRLYTHDDANNAGLGDRVRVMETRPMSKNKRWRLVDVLERAR